MNNKWVQFVVDAGILTFFGVAGALFLLLLVAATIGAWQSVLA